MRAALRQNETYVRDAFGAGLHDGACILEADHPVGHVRLDFGTHRSDSTRWDGWCTVTPNRQAHPLSGKVRLVNLIGRPS